MKTHLLIFCWIVLFFGSLHAQEKAFLNIEDDPNNTITVQVEGKPIKMPLKKAKATFGVINESVSFGLSLGFNNSLENIKTAQISPIDKTLIINNAQATSFVLSSVISVPITFKKKSYRLLDKEGKEMGQLHFEADWSIIGIVNLVTFKEAESGSIFNQKISGGLGVSYNMNNHVAFGFSYELISYRKPKDFLLDLEGEEIVVDGNSLTTLDVSDNRYFFDRYSGTLSLKVIYKLTTN